MSSASLCIAQSAPGFGRASLPYRLGYAGLLGMALLLLAPRIGVAQGASAPAGAQQVYEKERARCLRMADGDGRAACLTSAGAALQAARAGQLDTGQHDYRANQVARCAPLPPADRSDCMQRMDGGGTKSGSVSGGGILRETVTETPPTTRQAP